MIALYCNCDSMTLELTSEGITLSCAGEMSTSILDDTDYIDETWMVEESMSLLQG